MNVPLLDEVDRSIERGSQKAVGFLKDFKMFLFRTSLVQFAVGVILGGAISNSVNAFSNDILMPPVALVTGQVRSVAARLVRPACLVIFEASNHGC